MSYASRIVIKESEEELNLAYHKIKDSRIKLKVKSLLLFKKGKFKKQEDLAMHLCIGYSTLRLWLKKYPDEGFSSFIKVPARGKPKSLVTPELYQALEDKLNDSEEPIQSYKDAVLWVETVHNQKLGYHTLRKYMIKHFKCKLKVPRKSHYKKDEQAIEAFFKTT